MSPRSARAAVLTGLIMVALGSCDGVRGGGLGAMLRHDPGGGVIGERIDDEADYVWRRTKETLTHLSERKPVLDEEARRAYATVEGGSVNVTVEASEDPRSCVLRVEARQFGAGSDALARDVLTQIRAQIDP